LTKCYSINVNHATLEVMLKVLLKDICFQLNKNSIKKTS